MKRPVESVRDLGRIIVGLVLFGTLGACQSGPDEGGDPRSSQVDSLFSRYAEDGSPGGAVMVLQDGSVLHSRGYGLADLVVRTPLTPQTPVRLGSLTKAMTAMSIVLLAERGELSYDDPATRWLPELSRFEGVTVRHLLNHTSGLPDYYSGSPLQDVATAADRDAPFAISEAMGIYETWGEAQRTAGDEYEYSNPGYEALALIVERISGVSFGQFLASSFFEPLGMSTAVVRDLPETVIPERAVGYSQDSTSGEWVENDDHWGNWMVGAGGIYASLEDLQRWDAALWDWESDGRLSEVLAPARLNNGELSEYGFGWSVSDHLGQGAIHHTGSWVGFRNAIARFPEIRLTVIVLTNSTGPAAELRDAVASIYLDP